MLQVTHHTPSWTPLQQEGHHKEVAHAHAAEAGRAAAARMSREAHADADSKLRGSVDPTVAGLLTEGSASGSGVIQESREQGGGSGTQEGVLQHDEAERTEQLAILNRMVKEMKIKLAQVGLGGCELEVSCR